ncbi:hypothetical protein ABWU93_11620 [Xanthomonas translucens pv. translucens]|uniref:hypothetical protein n=1 Tax=Xanthomonas campestris pv. translucens TaxID=343 RepID=UPI003F6EBC17
MKRGLPAGGRRASFLWLGVASLCAGAAAALAAGAATADARGEDPMRVPAGLSITSPRLCAAVVVYRLATADDWGLRTTLAQTALNAFAAAGGAPDCAAPVTAALGHQFDPRRWQAALDAVDAVRSGDYTPSPAACARANAVVAADDGGPAGAAARAQCVIGNLAFVQVQP